MISVYDSLQTFDLQKYYVIASNSLIKSYSQMNFKLVKKNFCYDSKNNIDFLNIKDLHKITQKIFES
jgi:hypothetical protein